jgi:uncharacterized protein YlxP (DUF503 family)
MELTHLTQLFQVSVPRVGGTDMENSSILSSLVVVFDDENKNNEIDRHLPIVLLPICSYGLGHSR